MEKQLHIRRVSRLLLISNMVMALIYFSWWFFPGNIANPILYFLLFAGEIYHILISFGFWYTLWPRKTLTDIAYYNPTFTPTVDIFIPVTGEPVEIVKQTIQAAQNIRYPYLKLYVLNDGFVAQKENYKEIEYLCKSMNVTCITRTIAGGAKAGNINNALKQTKGEIVVIFDADMQANPEFLEKTIPYFQDKKIGFVQTPQYYINSEVNDITKGAWEQQEFFFGPIMVGKNSSNSAFICGTNVAIRRKALEEVGGMFEKNIAEDFLTSLMIHQKGWRSHYVSKVLAVGLAPEDLQSYCKQQHRWARGSLEVLFGANPLFKKGLSFGQKIQYLSSALYYFNGVVVLIDIVMPLIFLFTGVQPVSATTTSFAIFFIPFMFLNLYTLYAASDGRITFKAISFSQASFFLQLSALKSILLRNKVGFHVTPKKAQEGNFVKLVFPHLLYIGLVLVAIGVGITREGVNPSVVTNIAWCCLNIAFFMPFINSSLTKRVAVQKHALFAQRYYEK